ncbi:MAG: MoxR family ATPase [Myxococcota bacterium]
MFASIDETRERLAEARYVADEDLATTLYLALKMERPLFLEGAPGVGKTELARVLSGIFEAPLIRLQCYEGLDVHQALYEWNYPRQLLTVQALRDGGTAELERTLSTLYTEDYLLRRPLLQAIDAAHERPPVLLVDEIDRADEEFESFLLELLGDFQVTIPELGSVRAETRPIVILTSNRTRDVHDALKRRCLYAWIDYPGLEKEVAIVSRKVPGLGPHLTEQAVRLVQDLRQEELQKPPGVAETLDWAQALLHLGVAELDPGPMGATGGALLKHQEDLAFFRRWIGARGVPA